MVESSGVSKEATLKNIEDKWDDWYVKGLSDFIKVPNLTPMVDENFLTNGLTQQAMECVDKYVNEIELQGISKKIYEPEGCGPLIVYVIEPQGGATKNVMLYGHLDKQPWMDGWSEGLGPIDPVIRDGCLYGRGGADDGYSVFTCLLAVKNLQLQGLPVPRCTMVLETEEESGSPSLLKLLDLAKDDIGVPDSVFIMDSGAFDYNNLWITSSLRGVLVVELKVEAGMQGYHSGELGGILPETFRVVRELLSRVDD